MRLGYREDHWGKHALKYAEAGPAAIHWPASPEGAIQVILASAEEENGITRSEWQWIRLANGDLILGVYPQDELYSSIEEIAHKDFLDGVALNIEPDSNTELEHEMNGHYSQDWGF